MEANVFNKDEFIKSVKENVKNLYRKTLDEASQQEIFQAVSYTVKDVIIDDWLATQKAFDKQDPKMVYYMSMENCITLDDFPAWLDQQEIEGLENK